MEFVTECLATLAVHSKKRERRKRRVLDCFFEIDPELFV